MAQTWHRIFPGISGWIKSLKYSSCDPARFKATIMTADPLFWKPLFGYIAFFEVNSYTKGQMGGYRIR
jgi:hypothetical protein